MNGKFFFLPEEKRGLPPLFATIVKETKEK